MSLADQLQTTHTSLNDTVEVIAQWRQQFAKRSVWQSGDVFELFGLSTSFCS